MTTENTCYPVERVVCVKIEIDPPARCGQYIPHKSGSPEWYEAYEKALKHWSAHLVEFIRDHRSQDPLQISVSKEKEEFCSECGKSWEEVPPEEKGLLPTCSWCCRPVV